MINFKQYKCNKINLFVYYLQGDFKLKKIKYMFLTFILILSNTMQIMSYDEAEILAEWQYYNEVQEEISAASVDPTEIPKTDSRAVVVYDRTSKTVIYGKNENDKRAMASTTKIMTATLLLENADLSTEVTVSKNAASVGGSRLGLKAGDKIILNDLLFGLMLCSGNDCAVQIAETVGGSVENFAKMMNAKAKQIGLTNTKFVTPHGLDADGHYTTATELAILTDYALDNPAFAKVVSTKNYTVNINGHLKELNNTNELLGYLEGVNGVKTGFTNNALRCLATSTLRNNFNIITIVLGADTRKIRTKDTIKLIEYTYANYEQIDLSKMVLEEYEKWLSLYKIEINKGMQNTLKTKLGEQKYTIYPVNKADKNKIHIEISNINYIEAPVLENYKIGNIDIKIGENLIYTVDILTAEEIKKKDVEIYFFQMLGEFMHLTKL